MAKVFLFPGQGSQYVGMGKDLVENDTSAVEIYEKANEILGFDISRISFEGPEEELRKTQYTQPAIFTHSVVIDHLIQARGEKPAAVAGHSLGEFSALVSAGSLSFEDALKIVKVRSEEMAKAGSIQPGSMAAILGATDEQLEQICAQDGVVVPANVNAPGQIVISGEAEAVARAVATAKEIGVRRALPLNVSGAFHSPLMTPARAKLAEILDQVVFKNAAVPVYQNVTGSAVTDAAEIRENILKQLENPVLWAQSITQMAEDGFTDFVELGPGKVLQGLLRRINSELTGSGVDTYDQVMAYGN